ncbi:Fe-S cluster assembly ATP-binding protein [Tamilnaduibacter salinus]|uniref:Fe-S cluster assembly ATP-binding protein n=1 Tax=Tamilnaduibacter salinus TaxID=1484056 RepID=A0A2A2I6C6_9GAMM|nr:Fe-S cluster assembly ATPase SufC [Tamilnaduibacter salinus]PAV26593.1 Fe-S cluster assembly ATPase SufC [Tamilnaduibacter salinus]PVY75863.1 Fe-S cluster assembly ATP-binding protein [Tamilnaduibacter salinus]
MLSIRNLHAAVEGEEILKGINLDIQPGEVHAIMGPNGSGKSTLSQVLAGNETFEVTSGEVLLDGKNLLELETEERALAGIFLAFQYPVEIPGVSNLQFLRTAVNAHRAHQGKEELSAVDFMKLAKDITQRVDLDASFLKRGVNEGFSGGEKKRNEILQALLLEPRLAILDETDSGLDIDALKTVAQGVNELRSEDRAILMITHYQRLLDHIVPDKVHVLAGGRIVKSGDSELAKELEEHGYAGLGVSDDEEATAN